MHVGKECMFSFRGMKIYIYNQKLSSLSFFTVSTSLANFRVVGLLRSNRVLLKSSISIVLLFVILLAIVLSIFDPSLGAIDIYVYMILFISDVHIS